MDQDHRWERLFADLDASWQATERRELDSEIADRTRRERARVPLVDRFCAHRGHELELRLAGGLRVQGRVVDVGGDWIALAAGAVRGLLLPLDAIASVSGLTPRSTPDRTARRFGLGYALRAISRDRAAAQIVDRSGTTYTGTIDVVGADFIDLAEHPTDEPRRPDNVRASRTIPFAGLAYVRTG